MNDLDKFYELLRKHLDEDDDNFKKLHERIDALIEQLKSQQEAAQKLLTKFKK